MPSPPMMHMQPYSEPINPRFGNYTSVQSPYYAPQSPYTANPNEYSREMDMRRLGNQKPAGGAYNMAPVERNSGKINPSPYNPMHPMHSPALVSTAPQYEEELLMSQYAGANDPDGAHSRPPEGLKYFLRFYSAIRI